MLFFMHWGNFILSGAKSGTAVKGLMVEICAQEGSSKNLVNMCIMRKLWISHFLTKVVLPFNAILPWAFWSTLVKQLAPSVTNYRPYCTDHNLSWISLSRTFGFWILEMHPFLPFPTCFPFSLFSLWIHEFLAPSGSHFLSLLEM